MQNVLKLVKQLGKDEDGAALVEYTVLLGMITVAVIAIIVVVGQWVVNQWTVLNTTLSANPSDIRLKRDIALVQRLASGIGLYRYRYNWSDQVYVGVMAQEVARVVPDAVVRGQDGYLRVDYRRLGLRLMTWDEWTASEEWRLAA
jgi:Flp pilus assembly pilin Flp